MIRVLGLVVMCGLKATSRVFGTDNCARGVTTCRAGESTY
jgi:hypothetical protein